MTNLLNLPRIFDPSFSFAHISDVAFWSSVQKNIALCPSPLLTYLLYSESLRLPLFVVMDVELYLMYAANLAFIPVMKDYSSDRKLRGILDFLTWNYFQPPSSRDCCREHTCLVQPCGSGKIEIALIHHLHT